MSEDPQPSRPPIREHAGFIATVIGACTGAVSLIQTIASNEATIAHFIQVFGTVLLWAQLIFLVLLLLGGFLIPGEVLRRNSNRIFLVLAVLAVVGGSIAATKSGSDWTGAIIGYAFAAMILWSFLLDRGKSANKPDSSEAAS